MNTLDQVEIRRLAFQDQLDSLKTKKDRNKLGQFATPSPLARDILEYAKSLLAPGTRIRFFDPAFGTGSFYSALLRTFPAYQIDQASGYEIDAHYGQHIHELWGDTLLRLHLDDFTQALPPATEDAKANLLICNPPYVRHHHMTRQEKSRLQALLKERGGLKLSELAGLYCYFLFLAHQWMAENGIAGWLIPSEFMDVNYGQQVKTYLLSYVTLLRIHRFFPKEMQFDKALVSSSIVWFRKAEPPPNHTVEFTFGGTLAAPRASSRIPIQLLQMTPKWTQIALTPSQPAAPQGRYTLSDLFTIKRGLATGANEFFILDREQVEHYRLPAEFLIPILPNARSLSVEEINADEHGNPMLKRPLFLLTCNLPEAEVRVSYPTLWQYLQSGVKMRINERYLCSHRSPWYAQEERPPAPFLCTYMGRESMGNGPFRFILNHSRATAANTYLMLYPKPILAGVLEGNSEAVKAVWLTLRAISPSTLVNEGRVYGGGLHKMEPKELANVSAESLLVPSMVGLPTIRLG